MENDAILRESVLDNFMELARIPRPSGQEAAIGEYLYQRIQSMGLQVEKDEAGNIIADKPAAVGYEAVPLTALQAHMDMVCVAEDGVAYNPVSDPIRVKRSEEWLFAEGTSLGADDGIGIAEILYLLETEFPHGPLRAILTVDEEQGMSGAISLAERYLSDASYIINCDSEEYDVLTVGSAGNLVVDFEKKAAWETVTGPADDVACRVCFTGFSGGHSGEDISRGKGNAIRILALTLRQLREQGEDFRLASFSGGMARNSIPAKAEAILVVAKEKAPALERVLQSAAAQAAATVPAEKGLRLLTESVELPNVLLAKADGEALLNLLCVLHSGVYSMSQNLPGLVETSANIGKVMMEDETIRIQFLPRSAIDAKVSEFRPMASALAELAGFTVAFGAQSPGWAERKQSRLQTIMCAVFEEQNGFPMKVASIHAGLECGWFFRKNPNLDIVSIGVTAMDIHSPQERIKLSTIVPQVRLIMEVLRRLKNEK